MSSCPAAHPSEKVSAYAKSLAVEGEAALPRLVLHRLTRSLRPGKVFVDHSQNAAAKTTAAPYTLRARAEPTVSTPVTWEEVEAAENLVFRIGDIAPRLDRYGDREGDGERRGRGGVPRRGAGADGRGEAAHDAARRHYRAPAAAP